MFIKALIILPLFALATACEDEEDKLDGVQKVAIIQGLKTLALFKTQLAAYHSEHSTCNSNSISSNDVILTKRHYVQNVVTTDQCQIILTFKNEQTIPDVANKQIILSLIKGKGIYNWSCKSNITRKDLLPDDCI